MSIDPGIAKIYGTGKGVDAGCEIADELHPMIAAVHNTYSANDMVDCHFVVVAALTGFMIETVGHEVTYRLFMTAAKNPQFDAFRQGEQNVT